MVISPARRTGPDHLPIRRFSLIDAVRGGIPVQLGERRVLHPGRWRWLRAMAWLVMVFFLTAAAFGLPLQAAVDLLPPRTRPCSSPGSSSPARPPSAATPWPSGGARVAGPPSSRSARPCPASPSGLCSVWR